MTTHLAAEPDLSENVDGPVPPAVYVIREFEHVNIPADSVLRHGRLDVFASVASKGYFTISPQQGLPKLQAGGWVGVIPLNPRVTIDVRPRVPMSNLGRLLRLSGVVPVELEDTSKLYGHEPDLFPSLIAIYAKAMCRFVDTIGLRGLYREYLRQEGVTSFPRGRILMGATAKSLASKGVRHHVRATWFDRTADVPVNQAIKYAISLLAALHRKTTPMAVTRSDRILRALNNAYRSFDGVAMDSSLSFLRDPVVSGARPLPSLRGYYRAPLDLALAVIHQHAVTLEDVGTHLDLPSIVLNMAEAFENYLREVLVRASQGAAWDTRVLDGNKRGHGGGRKHLMDDGVNVQAQPDIVLASGGRVAPAYPLIIEVKYKPAHKYDRADLNQAIAYGVSYRSPAVVVAQPRGNRADPPSGLRRLGSMRDMEVYQYTFDLNVADMEAEEDRFASAIHGLCGVA